MALLAAPIGAAKEFTVMVGMDDERASVANLRYYPEAAVIEVGDTITWTSAVQTPHSVTQYPPGPSGFDSSPLLTPDDPLVAAWFGPDGFLMPGQSFSHVFSEMGTFDVFCKIHPGMTARVTVTGPQPGISGNAVDVAAGWGSGDTTVDRFGPDNVSIAAGTTVRWTNMHSAEPHTVTILGPGGEMAADSSPAVTQPPDWFEQEGGLLNAASYPSFSHTFESAGSYVYFCKLHPGMFGSIVVLSAAESNGSAPGPALAAGLLALALVALARRRG